MADTAPLQSAPPERFSREMGISHAEFFRTLPAAVAPYRLRRASSRVLVEQEERKLVLTLHPEGQRQIASLRLPTTVVEFAFIGFSDSERGRFMRHFDLCYQRGGG